jgi:hypothetical protein
LYPIKSNEITIVLVNIILNHHFDPFWLLSTPCLMFSRISRQVRQPRLCRSPQCLARSIKAANRAVLERPAHIFHNNLGKWWFNHEKWWFNGI